MNVLLSDIPGLAEVEAAARREIEHLREIAFLDVPLRMCAQDVEQFKPRHSQLLSIAGNPFVVGGMVGPLDVIQFLWIVSAGFTTNPEDAAAFASQFDFDSDEDNDEDFENCKAEIYAYLDDAFMDRRPSRKTASAPAPQVCSTASIIHDVAATYGWSRETICNTPFGALLQYIRLIDADRCASHGWSIPPSFSRLDRVRSAFIREYLAGLPAPKKTRSRKRK